MDVPAPSISEELEQLINAGNMRVASLKAQTYMAQHPDKEYDAHFLSQLHLAVSLEGHAAQDLIRKAALARGYDAILAADMQIDGVVLPLLRAGHPKQADDELMKLLKVYSGRPNHVAKWMMIKGRIDFALGKYESASVQHMEAESIFNLQAILGDVNETWRRNNVYHRFRTERCRIRFLHPSYFKLVWQLYEEIRKDPSRHRSQVFGTLILVTGRFGCWLEDSLLKWQNRRFA